MDLVEYSGKESRVTDAGLQIRSVHWTPDSWSTSDFLIPRHQTPAISSAMGKKNKKKSEGADDSDQESDFDATIIDSLTICDSPTPSTSQIKKPSKKAAEKEKEMADARHDLLLQFSIYEDSEPESIIGVIYKLTFQTESIFSRSRSVTKQDKSDIIRLQVLIRAATGLLNEKATSSFKPTMSETQTQTTPVSDSFSDSGSNIIAAVREELEKFKSEFLTPGSDSHPKSFAAAVAKTPYRHPVKTPVSRPALVLESSNPTAHTHKDALDSWRKNVSFRDSGFAPAKVQTVSNGKVRVEFDTAAQRDSALDKIKRVPGLKAEESKRRRPLVIMKGVSKESEFEDGVKLMFTQNPSLKDSGKESDVSLRFKRRNKNDSLYNIVFEVTPAIRMKMLEIGRLNFDHQRLRVSDYSPFLQCYKCLQFGHVQSRCPSESTRCSHCSSDSHGVATCPDSRDSHALTCFNCKEYNTKTRKQTPTSHSATSLKECPRIQSMVTRLCERTDYGC